MPLFLVKSAAESDSTAIDLDFSAYGIELYGDEDSVWMPVPTLCDCFSIANANGIYYHDQLVFIGNILEIANTITPENAGESSPPLSDSVARYVFGFESDVGLMHSVSGMFL